MPLDKLGHSYYDDFNMDEQTPTPPPSNSTTQGKISQLTPPSSTTLPSATEQHLEGHAQTSSPTARKNIAQMVADLLNKLPPLPENWKELFIKWYPILLIVGALLALPWVLAALGIASLASVFTFGGFWALVPGAKGTGFMLIIAIVNIVISLIGGFQMRKMKKTGWNLAMASEGLDLISTLGGGGSTLGLLISLIIIYFLWQVKQRYL